MKQFWHNPRQALSTPIKSGEQRPMGEYDEMVKSIEVLIEDSEFQNLHKRLSENTIFDILGISLEERIHSRMLGWLLDPSESHGLGATIIRRFLSKAAQVARSQKLSYGEAEGQPITSLSAETFSFSDLVIRPEYRMKSARRPDLLLTSKVERWLCLIENKILSEEGNEQTADYYVGLRAEFPSQDFPNRLFVYLSPKGLRPESRQFVPISYSDVAHLLETNLGIYIVGKMICSQCVTGQSSGENARERAPIKTRALSEADQRKALLSARSEAFIMGCTKVRGTGFEPVTGGPP
jgi:hypothetical protein